MTRREAALRGALIELLESWKDLYRVCSECAFPDAPEDTYEHTKRLADRAFKRATRVVRETSIKL